MMVLVFFLTETVINRDSLSIYPIAALAGIPIALYIRYNISSNMRVLLFLLIAALMGYGLVSQIPSEHHQVFNSHPRILIFTSLQNKQLMDSMNDMLEESSNEYVYVDSFDQIIYFISHKKDPMAKSYLSIWDGPSEYYQEVLGNLVAKEVGKLVLRQRTLNFLPIQEYVNTHYEYESTFGGYDIYSRLP